MKWTIALTMALCVATLDLNSASAQTRYPMTCRGGRGYSLEIYKDRTVVHGGRTLTNQVILSFKHGTKPAYEGLNEGECAWADRAMWANEPTALCMNNVSLKVTLENDGEGWLLHFFGPNESGQELQALTGLESDSEYQTFWVYNDRYACMRF